MVNDIFNHIYCLLLHEFMAFDLTIQKTFKFYTFFPIKNGKSYPKISLLLVLLIIMDFSRKCIIIKSSASKASSYAEFQKVKT
jgi:hypothetical protein